jgi:hypothetical protein
VREDTGKSQYGHFDPLAQEGLQLFWTWESKPRGRPRIPGKLRKLIVNLAKDNPTWGEERIAAEQLLRLGIRVSPRAVRRSLPARKDHRAGPRFSPG